MKYLLVTASSYGLSYWLVGLLIQGRLADIAEGLRHRPDAPAPGLYLREVAAQARQARRRYSLFTGSLLAMVACAVLWWAQ